MAKHYRAVCLGGTFDHLHRGHKHFLREVFKVATTAFIGITRDAQDKRYPEAMQPYQDRVRALRTFLDEEGYTGRYHVGPLIDGVGPAATSPEYQAVVETRETKAGARHINTLRQARGLPRLAIVVVPLLASKDRRIIRSTRGRAGEINRDGLVYRSRLGHKKVISDGVKERLRKPLGKVFRGTDADRTPVSRQVVRYIQEIRPSKLIAVGDIVTADLMGSGLKPDLAVIDHKTQRHHVQHQSRYSGRRVLNPAGTLTKRAVAQLAIALKSGRPQILIVRGEEDLMAIPAILFAPLGSLVVYGQWNLGVVAISVTEEKKQEVLILTSLLHK